MARVSEPSAPEPVVSASVVTPPAPTQAPRLLPYAGEASSPDVQHLLAQLNAAYSSEDTAAVARIRGTIEALGYRA
jgi:hypothetical protein